MDASSSSSDSSIIRREAPPAIVRSSNFTPRRPTTPTLDSSPDPSNASLGLSSAAYSAMYDASLAPSPFATPSYFEAEEFHHHVVCAVAESRSAGVIGLATINLNLASSQIITIANESNYTTLKQTLSAMQHKPTTFITLPRITADRASSRLAEVLEDEIGWPTYTTTMPRGCWDKALGIINIEYYAYSDQIVPLKVILSSNNFYAACAFAAVISYIESYHGLAIRAGALNIEYVEPSGVMRMDKAAIQALELLRNGRQAQPGDNTLFALANNTRTPEGRRLLTRSVLQPMTNEEEINLHHDAVETLCGDEDVFRKLRDWLKEFDGIDLESISGWLAIDHTVIRQPVQSGIVSSSGRHMSAAVGAHELSQAEGDLSRVLGLKSYLKKVQALHQLLRAADVTDHLLASVASKTGADKTGPTLGLLASVLQEDAAYSRSAAEIGHARMWAIRALPNDAIDLARAEHRRTREEAEAYFALKLALFQEVLGEAAAPKLFDDKDKGLCFKFKWADVRQYVDTDEPQPGEIWGQAKIGCVRVNLGIRRGEHYLCQTDRLLELSQQLRVHSDIITKESDKYVLELRNAITEAGYVADLTSIAKAVAQLDLICSHAELTTTHGYVRPKLGKELALIKARHPIMEARRGFVPNDVFSGDDTKFVVVTGTNMGGKTTYIKTIALMQILAQIGCFVPAERAAVPICDRIFVRSATNDNAAGNAGTFAVEMDEMSVILHGATNKSLVIIDELGRGTSTAEGLGLAAAMAEELVKKKSRVFFATHFLDLGKMLNAWYPSQVLNVHMTSHGSVEDGHATISLPHTVVAGPVNNWDYGLELASRYFPASLIESARHWSKYHQEQVELSRKERTSAEMKSAAEIAVMHHMEQALSSQMSNMELAERLELVTDQYKALEERGEVSNEGGEASNDNAEA
ncbi:hypothetical protein QC762_0003390 [Podospora pseudocomata]|uniref:DNA mismatch repair proteins mutS family domain-containing protein n=1 Tax=Podospora pseudocomata TaxID=2093779 RepID=A0ABR0GT60_9PEZI|nr:hypothetical protein QC762_0003390 [Podospora pseudocomata]